jgi:hypothetical protein
VIAGADFFTTEVWTCRGLVAIPLAQTIRAHGKSAAIVVGQLQASAPQLAAKHTILVEQITKDILLLVIQPPGKEREQQLKRGDVDHGRSLYQAAGRGRRQSIQLWDITPFL